MVCRMKRETMDAVARHSHVAVLVAMNLLIGILLSPKYGQGIDEGANVRYGEMSIRSYSDPLHPYRDPSREDKGPFYFMAWVAAASFVERAVPAWLGADARHFVNFVTWQLAMVSVYVLALRVAQPSAAFFGALLFESQPLLFGHGFINQKDSPFMAFFAAAVVVGLAAADRLGGPGRQAKARRASFRSPASLWREARDVWWEGPAGARRNAIVAVLLVLGAPLAWTALDGPITAAVSTIVRDAYRGTAWGPINELFSRLAQNAAMTPVASYVARANLVVDVAAVVGAALLAMVAVWATGWLWRGLGEKLRIEIPKLVLPAAILLGMATAIRSTALFAFLLVAGYAFIRVGARGIGFALAYLGIAGGVAFVLWPQLWGSPFELLRSSLERTLHFPEEQEVLFRGSVYLSHSLPRIYLPWLLVIQFTLPAVGLVLAGLAMTINRAIREWARTPFYGILILWFFVPLAAVVVFQVPIYNNFRQLLFMIPPLFVMAAMVLDRLARFSRKPWVLLLGAVAILPGFIGVARLHPYEYVYYNELVGGVGGAFGQYPLDYWCTSYREVMRAVNEVAPPNARIAVWGPKSAAQPFFREDLKLVEVVATHSSDDLDAFVVIGCSWATTDRGFFPDSPVLSSVQREGVPLGIVKQIDAAPSSTDRAPGP